MSETDINRKWLVGSRLASGAGAVAPNRDAETLLYYQRQLEAELSYVRRQLLELGLQPGSPS